MSEFEQELMKEIAIEVEKVKESSERLEKLVNRLVEEQKKEKK